jgi:hypothetical protein
MHASGGCCAVTSLTSCHIVTTHISLELSQQVSRCGGLLDGCTAQLTRAAAAALA